MGKMQQFKRHIRSANGKMFAFDLRTGFGAVLGGLFEKVARGKVHDSEIREIYGMEDDGDNQGGEHVKMTAGPQLTPSQKPGKYTALVSLHGVALYDFEWQPYAFSTLLLSQVMETLTNDPSVETIVLDINTPGGHVTGTQEAADAVYRAAKKKTVIGIINPLCASAGYWIGSQCSKLIAVPSADVGSIGVFMTHYDCSAMMQDAGIKPTFIYAGEYKTEGNSMQPLSEDARAFYQSEVDQTYDDFLTAVARGRGVSKETVLEKFGKGRCYTAPVAKRLGMVDDVATIRLALQSVGLTMEMDQDGRRRRGEAERPADQAGQAASIEAESEPKVESASDQVVSGDGCDHIVFRQDQAEDGTVKIYALTAWPAKTTIHPEAVAGSKQIAVAGETITVAVENGAAVYTKAGITDQGTWVCTLADGSKFEEPPAAPDLAVSDGAARLREVEAAARDRRLAIMSA